MLLTLINPLNSHVWKILYNIIYNTYILEKAHFLLDSVFRMVREFANANDVKQIRKLVQILTKEFAVSHNPHSRKGGLIGLAATAIALGKVRRPGLKHGKISRQL